MGLSKIKFATNIVCKAFEKKQAPVQVLSTRSQKGKINFYGDAEVSSLPVGLKIGGANKKKVKPRKSPALKKKRSPAKAKSGTKATGKRSPVRKATK